MNASSYASAIELNNEGAIHLQHGRFLNAAKSFHSALDTIKSAMEEPPPPNAEAVDDDEGKEDDNEVAHDTVSFEWSEDPRRVHMKLPQQYADDGNDDDDDDTFVYRRALVIKTAGSKSSSADDGYVQESAAILFNLALSYHLYGLESKSRYLHTALRFYELAFGLRHSSSSSSSQQQHQPSSSTSTSDNNSSTITTVIIHHLFDLALLNNLGQLHYAIFNFDKSLQCFVHLSEELSWCCQQQQSMMEQCDYMGFMLNLTLQAPTAAPQA